MSDEFLRVARQEIQSDLDILHEIICVCTSDQQTYEKSREIEKRLHKIKGLAPMMRHEKVGEIARICDTMVKHIIDHGAVTGMHDVIFDAIEKMQQVFNGRSDVEIEDLKSHVRKLCPQIKF